MASPRSYTHTDAHSALESLCFCPLRFCARQERAVRGTAPGLPRLVPTRGVGNNALVVGAANSVRNYPDARHLLWSCRFARTPDGADTVLEQSSGPSFRRRRHRRYKVTFLEFREDLLFARRSSTRRVDEAISRDIGSDNAPRWFCRLECGASNIDASPRALFRGRELRPMQFRRAFESVNTKGRLQGNFLIQRGEK